MLRPLAYKLHPAPPDVSSVETTCAIRTVCHSADEFHIRAHLIAMLEKMTAVLQSVSSADVENSDEVQVTAEVRVMGRPDRPDAEFERIVSELSMEPGITAVSWAAVSVSAE